MDQRINQETMLPYGVEPVRFSREDLRLPIHASGKPTTMVTVVQGSFTVDIQGEEGVSATISLNGCTTLEQAQRTLQHMLHLVTQENKVATPENNR